ncbi:MAG TPA: pentapeptide repeat-containing protein, partial [Phototrophicaceae bacterium]|nr:pentapeptide repeat-containing protein [Phototrophicaceae bacterium]
MIFRFLMLASPTLDLNLKGDSQNPLVIVILVVIVMVVAFSLLWNRYTFVPDEQTLLKAHLAQLAQSAGSRVNQEAVNAVQQLREHGKLTGESGLLTGAYLFEANLQGADLTDASLERANLSNTLLQRANLTRANLQGAVLQGANLQGAKLVGANLQSAYFQEANLQGADLTGAKLENAYFGPANDYPVVFDQSTILPDGTRWTPDADLTKFT